jgi:hypothetical protein
MACRRGSGDDLLDALSVKWSVNLFRVPRTGIEVGDLFVVQKRYLDPWDRLTALYQPPLELPRSKPQEMGDMDGAESNIYAANVGFDALEGFLLGLGVPAVPLKASIGAARDSDATISFRVASVRSRSLLPGEIKREMDVRWRTFRLGSLDAQRKYVVAHAVWEAKTLQINLDGRKETVGRLSASLTKLASGTTGVHAEKISAGQIRYARDKFVTFGIQVTRLSLVGEKLTLEGVPDLSPMRVRLGGVNSPADKSALEKPDPGRSVLIGRSSGSPFVDFKVHGTGHFASE